MGSSEFLQALLSTEDKVYESNFSLKTKTLLNFCKFLFPKYIKLAANTRLKLKRDIIRIVEKLHPDVLIELGSGYSKDYISLMNKKLIQKIVQVDKESIINAKTSNYRFIEGDITKVEVWNKLIKIRCKKGVIVAEGLFSYLNDEEFNFVMNKLKGLLENRFVLITHEPLKQISFSRKIISLFIGKTYRRFNSVNQIKNYYKSLGLKSKILSSTKWQAIYQIYSR